ncbi:hypothetical protein A2U01_0066070, partial [Trifolium medium]|nr:hypothetical protein [Trifolium medium]
NVLKNEKKLYVLKEPIPEEEPPSSAHKAERYAYKKHVDDALEVGCVMLATMNSELQKQQENMDAFDMIEHLKPNKLIIILLKSCNNTLPFKHFD